MTVFILAAISLLLLFIPLQLTALTTADFGTLKFFINFFTHQLAHGNFQHFLGNYTFLIPFALFLEHKIGRLKFLIFFFTCGIFSASLFMLSSPWSIGMVGSSGAAFGVMVGAIAHFKGTKRQRAVAFLLTAAIMFNQAALGFFNPDAGVAFWGHFGGALGALLLITFFPEFHSKSKSDLN